MGVRYIKPHSVGTRNDGEEAFTRSMWICDECNELWSPDMKLYGNPRLVHHHDCPNLFPGQEHLNEYGHFVPKET